MADAGGTRHLVVAKGTRLRAEIAALVFHALRGESGLHSDAAVSGDFTHGRPARNEPGDGRVKLWPHEAHTQADGRRQGSVAE